MSHNGWSYSRLPDPNDPKQGWKLHVAATIFSASEVFTRSRPILQRHRALYKLPASFELLLSLNAGLEDYCQVGKFLTVYPRTEQEAVQLAAELHRATTGLAGPRVPSDRPYRPTSIVHYRYGSFRHRRRIITDLNGKAHADTRSPHLACPTWLTDPFRARVRKQRGPLGVQYLPFRAKAQRGKGGVYLALDLTTLPPRHVIIKEGRRHGETGLDGEDGYSRVQREARTLRALRRVGVAVPGVLREFTQNGNRYVVLEKLPGRSLIPTPRRHAAKSTWRTMPRILRRLQTQLDLVHGAGFVWRECKPEHVLIHRGEIRVIDFEGACRIEDTKVLPWSSADYLPSWLLGRKVRCAGFSEDNYALGVIAYQFVTGSLPPRTSNARNSALDRMGCSTAVRSEITRLLAG